MGSQDVSTLTDRLGTAATGYPYGTDKGNAASNDQPDFATYTKDGTTGFEYANQRYYSAGLGRFLTADPHVPGKGGPGSSVDPSSWNRYSYTRGDPVNRLDWLGTCDASSDDDDSVTACADSPDDVDPVIIRPPQPFGEGIGSAGGKPSPEDRRWSRAQEILSNGNQLLHKVLLGSIPPDCQKDLDAIETLGIGSFQIPYTVDHSQWIDGMTSADPQLGLFTQNGDPLA
jgi:RHS repeat-associated protein